MFELIYRANIGFLGFYRPSNERNNQYMSQGYQPPYSITANILNAVAEISELLGRWSASHQDALSPQLRRENRIRTIYASLAIEHNSLSLEQVTAILEGKPVFGLPREIQEVRNAFAAYEQLPHWQVTNGDHLLAAHERLMLGLIDNAGQWRSGGVGIFRDQELVHMAPPATQIPRLMNNLLGWLATTDIHPLIASCVFHYEFEFIHPFSDGNGRLGRLPLVSVKVSGETQLAIIQALQQNPELTIPMLATHLGVSSRTIERHLQKLQQQGALKRIGSAKGGYWQV